MNIEIYSLIQIYLFILQEHQKIS